MSDITPFVPRFATHASPVDHRDHKDVTLGASPYPAKYIHDISKLEMRMQYNIGKCTGAGDAKRVDDLQNITSSDDFIYLATKKLIDLNETEGSSIRSVLQLLQTKGACLQSTWSVPVTQSMTYDQYILNYPPTNAFTEALNHKIGQYISIPINVELIKAAIYKYGMLVVRMEVGQEWWTDTQGNTTWNSIDILPLRAPKQVVSGHCIVIYGYDTTLVPGKTVIYMSNSWSTGWANQGNGYFYFEDYQPTEAWAVTMDPVPAPNVPQISNDTFLKLIQLLHNLGVYKF